jgi:predicted ATP-dependent endonuclease of OLD family
MGNKMQINKITIDNFRAKTHINMHLGERFTLLIGENGTGKSTILDAIFIGLGAMLTHLPKVTGVSFKNTHIKQTENKTAPCSCVKIETSRGIVWDRTLRRDKSKKTASKIPPAVGLSALKNISSMKSSTLLTKAMNFSCR